MSNLLKRAINCDDGDRAAKIIQDALGIELDEVCRPVRLSPFLTADHQRLGPGLDCRAGSLDYFRGQALLLLPCVDEGADMDCHFAPKEVELLVARKGFRFLRGNVRGGSKLLDGVVVARGQRPQYFKDCRRRLRGREFVIVVGIQLLPRNPCRNRAGAESS